MKFLTLERELPGASADQFQPHFKGEAHHVWETQRSGSLAKVYLHAEACTSALVLECDHETEVRRLLARRLQMRTRLIDFDLIPLASYDGFARLFSEANHGEKIDD